MNNDLEQFSEERLKELASTPEKYDHRYTCNMLNGDESRALARIALAAKQAKPIGKIHVKRESYADIDEFEVRIECLHPEADWESFKDGTLLYDTPPALQVNSPVIPDGWIKCSERMPSSDGAYLCWDGRYVTTYAFIFGNWQANQFIAKNITHWMPLPAAPKPEM